MTARSTPIKLSDYPSKFFAYFDPEDFRWLVFLHNDVVLAFINKLRSIPADKKLQAYTSFSLAADIFRRSYQRQFSSITADKKLVEAIAAAEGIELNDSLYDRVKLVALTAKAPLLVGVTGKGISAKLDRTVESFQSAQEHYRKAMSDWEKSSPPAYPGLPASGTAAGHSSSGEPSKGEGDDSAGSKKPEESDEFKDATSQALSRSSSFSLGDKPTEDEISAALSSLYLEALAEKQGFSAEHIQKGQAELEDDLKKKLGSEDPAKVSGSGEKVGKDIPGYIDIDEEERKKAELAAKKGKKTTDQPQQTPGHGAGGGDGGGGGGDSSDDGSGDGGRRKRGPSLDPEWKRKRTMTADEKLDELMSLPDPGRISVTQARLVIHENSCSVKDVLSFIYDNDLDSENYPDTCFAIIVSYLVSRDVIPHDGTPPTFRDLDFPPFLPLFTGFDSGKYKIRVGMINQARIDKYKLAARLLSVVAIHMVSQGSWTGEVSWYQSYCQVRGSFLSSARFSTISQLIMEGGKLQSLCERVTLKELSGENNVLKYRLTRLSSPRLVKTAVELMPYAEVIKHFDLDALSMYQEFDSAGLVAQVAAGPLSMFCKGFIDPFLGDDAPGDASIADLSPIGNPPYHAPTLRKANIILEVCNFPLARWYQGEKAMALMNHEDTLFRTVVTTVMGLVRQTAVRDDLTGVHPLGSPDFDEITGSRRYSSILKKWKKA